MARWNGLPDSGRTQIECGAAMYDKHESRKRFFTLGAAYLVNEDFGENRRLSTTSRLNVVFVPELAAFLSITPFLLSLFSLGDKIENCSAQFLAVCWIVHVEFKLHRLCDGFGISNSLLLGQSLPAFIGHNLDKIGDGTVL